MSSVSTKAHGTTPSFPIRTAERQYPSQSADRTRFAEVTERPCLSNADDDLASA